MSSNTLAILLSVYPSIKQQASISAPLVSSTAFSRRFDKMTPAGIVCEKDASKNIPFPNTNLRKSKIKVNHKSVYQEHA